MAAYVPSYLRLLSTGELAERADRLRALLERCTVCPHDCGNNRLRDERSRCHTGLRPVVSSATVHFGEEPLIGGTRGVGNIFFGNCNLRCVYCQNYQISQNHREERVHEVDSDQLASMMLDLQERGVHALGLVSPSHVVPQIVEALVKAAENGLCLPLIYNTNAYDSVSVLALLEGIVDIYLPDLKYANEADGVAYSKVKRYPVVARAAIAEMHRQVGSDLVIGDDGLVKRGLVIRHLVLPNDLAGSAESLRWVKDTLGSDTTLSVMAQYYPVHQALTTPLLDRKVRESEYDRVLRLLENLGLENGWQQEYDASDYYRPEFENRAAPFTGEPRNSL
jgi:putative pyruvate formate lyase activating enzyme